MKPYIIKLNVLQWIETSGKTSFNCKAAKTNMEETRQYMMNRRLNLINIYAIRKEIKIKLKENDLKIASLIMRMEKEQNEINSGFLKLLYALNEQNVKLKIRIYEFTEDTMEKWKSFIVGYNRELDEVCKTLSELVEKNLKNN